MSGQRLAGGEVHDQQVRHTLHAEVAGDGIHVHACPRHGQDVVAKRLEVGAEGVFAGITGDPDEIQVRRLGQSLETGVYITYELVELNAQRAPTSGKIKQQKLHGRVQHCLNREVCQEQLANITITSLNV